MSISANILSRCNVALGTNVEQCGALTACDLKHVQSGDLATIYQDDSGNYRLHGALVEADFLGRAYGAKTNGLYDFFAAHTRILGPRRMTVEGMQNGMRMILPFVRMQRNRNINNVYWTVAVDASTAGYNQTDDIVLRISSQHSIPLDARWFPAGMRFFVLGVHTASGSPAAGDTAYRLAFSVVSSQVVDTYIEVTASPQNAASYFADDDEAAMQAKAEVPTDLDEAGVLGVLVRGTPNVANSESHCAEIPGLNNTQLVPFWIETTRYSMCEDELTMKYLQALREGNPYFKMYGDVETVKLNRQIVEDFQARHAWNLFFNKPLNSNQTLAAWNSLPSITLPNMPQVQIGDGYDVFSIGAVEGRCVGKRANAVGIYEQLAQCERVVDLEGESLDVRQLINTLIYIQRNREGANIPADIIELYTDSITGRELGYAILQYMVNRFPTDANSNSVLRINRMLDDNKAEQGPFGFRFLRYALDYPKCELRIVTHRFFDDMLAAYKAVSMDAGGRMIMIPDWTTIYPAVFNTQTVVNQSGSLQDLAKIDDTMMCVMEVPTRKQRLTSTTYTMVCEAENTSAIIENFSATPTAPSANTDDAYLEY